jgi:hypothetical protein
VDSREAKKSCQLLKLKKPENTGLSFFLRVHVVHAVTAFVAIYIYVDDYGFSPVSFARCLCKDQCISECSEGGFDLFASQIIWAYEATYCGETWSFEASENAHG